jgi:hypothetical protein
MILFEEKDRFDFQYAEHGVSIFEFFDSNAENRVKIVRDVLNDWFSRYPDSHKADLKQGFKNNFYTAMYELFIHELFIKQGFQLFPHPTIPNSTKRPDFLVVKDSIEFYIEATVLKGISEEESKKQNFHDNLISQLQKINSPNCWLAIYSVKFKSDKQPATKTIKKAIEEKLAEIDPDELAAALSRNPIGFKKFNYEDDKVKIELAALPKSEEARGEKGIRPIGLQYSGVSITPAAAESDLIKESFKGKAIRYGKLDKPFLICINLDNIKFNLNHDVTWAFMGDGFFSSDTPKYTRTSGVFVTRFNPFSLFTSAHRLIVHPFAQNKLDTESILLTHEIPNERNSTLVEKFDVEAILKS